MHSELLTPYERGNKNQTSTWEECIAFYRLLEARFPHIVQLSEIGMSDAGTPIHAGTVSADGVHDFAVIKKSNRPVFFNNNGIHPGEPEGIDACMALVRDFCIQPELLKMLKKMVFLFIPVYNVDGCRRRNNSSRVNQQGPETFGFRGNAMHMDLNRDFIKCDSQNAQVFNRFFTAWDPDLMVDTHTSNGADYSYTMTVIQTQADKLGLAQGEFVRNVMMPAIAEDMTRRGWPICPYVNPVKETPEDGIEDFLDLPRFSTGYAALNYTIGLMPETHMLKSFRHRYESMRAFVEAMVSFTSEYSDQIQAQRQAARSAGQTRTEWAVRWKPDYSNGSKFQFKGYASCWRPSILGNYARLYYDTSKPWEKQIDYFDHYVPEVSVTAPVAYVIPQQWREVIQRLEWNGVKMERLTESGWHHAQTYHIQRVQSRSVPYEGRMFHDEVELQTRTESVWLEAGDCVLPVGQQRSRYAIETLEPLAHDSFFRWGFFNSVLEKKEHYSNYIFEDTAAELLAQDPQLKAAFEQWKLDNPQLLASQQDVLDFIFFNCKKYNEPEWRRYPVFRLMQRPD